MNSIKGISMTLDHVSTLTPEEKDVVGQVGQNPLNGDNLYLSVDLVVKDQNAIEEVKHGKNYLSCAYTCEIEVSNGRWLGIEYDGIQRGISYAGGHLAIVDSPRAGETAQIRLDSLDAVMVDGVKQDKEEIIKEGHMDTTVKIDASEVKEAVKDAVNEINIDALQKQIETLTKEKTVLEADKDTFKDKVDSLEKKVVELEATKMDEVKIKAAVERRVKILDSARLAEVEVTDAMDEITIQKAVIAKIFPKANLDGKDQIYIDARFDGAVEMIAAQNDSEVRKVASEETVVTDSKEEIVDSNKAREAYVKNLTSAKK